MKEEKKKVPSKWQLVILVMLPIFVVREELFLKNVNALQFNDALESSVEGELQFVFIHNNRLL